MEAKAQCRAARKDGTPCRARARPSGFCFVHDPELGPKRNQARRRGGYASSNRARLEKQFPEDLEIIRSTLDAACARLLAGSMEPRVASAIASVVTVRLKLHEIGDTEAR